MPKRICPLSPVPKRRWPLQVQFCKQLPTAFPMRDRRFQFTITTISGVSGNLLEFFPYAPLLTDEAIF